jgi:hypothetical protein
MQEVGSSACWSVKRIVKEGNLGDENIFSYPPNEMLAGFVFMSGIGWL